MPSGYTSDIYEGKEVTGQEFIMKCARAFGATIMMRDEPLDKEIQEFQPSDYHLKNVANSKQNLLKFKNMTLEDAQVAVDESYESSLAGREITIKKRTDLKNRYEGVLREVSKWNPPTSEHVELKEYAINQLQESIKFDCSTSYYDKYPVIKRSPQEYINDMIAMYEKDIAYHTKEYDEEVARTFERNQWVKQLKESLK